MKGSHKSFPTVKNVEVPLVNNKEIDCTFEETNQVLIKVLK